MKRFLTLLATLMLSVSLFAQNVEDIKFLGLPINGTSANMVAQLKDKGFKHTIEDDTDILIGDFNGRKSNIFIHTNKNKVDRIMVSYARFVDEAQIKIDFNNLLQQFKNNEKYVEFEEQNPIPEDEDISYEITVHKKRYDVAFYPKPDLTEDVQEALAEAMKGMSEDEINVFSLKWTMEQYQRGQVWFTIREYGYDQYSISIYYDNLRNRSNGDEL